MQLTKTICSKQYSRCEGLLFSIHSKFRGNRAFGSQAPQKQRTLLPTSVRATLPRSPLPHCPCVGYLLFTTDMTHVAPAEPGELLEHPPLHWCVWCSIKHIHVLTRQNRVKTLHNTAQTSEVRLSQSIPQPVFYRVQMTVSLQPPIFYSKIETSHWNTMKSP